MLAGRRLTAELALIDADGRSPNVSILNQGLLRGFAALLLGLAAQGTRRAVWNRRDFEARLTLAFLVQRDQRLRPRWLMLSLLFRGTHGAGQ